MKTLTFLLFLTSATALNLPASGGRRPFLAKVAKTLPLLPLLFFTANADASSAVTDRVEFTIGNLNGEGHDGAFTVNLHEEWAPLGVTHFKSLVQNDCM